MAVITKPWELAVDKAQRVRRRIVIELDANDSLVNFSVELLNGAGPGSLPSSPTAKPSPAPSGGSGGPAPNHDSTLLEASLPPEVRHTPDAWGRFIDELIGSGELWRGFRGLQPDKILTTPGVGSEIRHLQIMGVGNPHECVLRYGPERCKQVRVWANKKSAEQSVKNLPGLVTSTLGKFEKQRA